MRTLCFGGTFNPIHHGHLIGARAVAESCGFNRVLLIPNLQSPHKQGDTSIAGPEHRLAMCRLAIAGDRLFDVSDIELQRTGPSFTVDTVQQLRSAGWSEVHWLIGADAVRGLPTWHKAAELMTNVQFEIMARPGWDFDWSTIPFEFHLLKRNVRSAPLIDISSTTVRDRVAAGKPIAYLTPLAVVEYIRLHNLYRRAAIDCNEK
jgi:nicotinate-nucleotide adenylyltransferase